MIVKRKLEKKSKEKNDSRKEKVLANSFNKTFNFKPCFYQFLNRNETGAFAANVDNLQELTLYVKKRVPKIWRIKYTLIHYGKQSLQ